jgi:hypothetical protein
MANRLDLNDRGSFLEDENQMVIDAEIVDEGTFYADYQIALMSDNNYLKGRFNQFYDLTPEDDEYLEWDEEA